MGVEVYTCVECDIEWSVPVPSGDDRVVEFASVCETCEAKMLKKAEDNARVWMKDQKKKKEEEKKAAEEAKKDSGEGSSSTTQK